MPSANCRRWLFPAVMFAIVAVVAAPFVCDYLTLRHLQGTGRQLRVGMSPDDVRQALGSPHVTTEGWFGLATPGYKMTDTVWSYHTRFDWIGEQYPSSPDLRPYWRRWLFPELGHCRVLDVWFRDGKVIGVTIPREGTIVE